MAEHHRAHIIYALNCLLKHAVLVEFIILSDFTGAEDEQFEEEKELIMKEIERVTRMQQLAR